MTVNHIREKSATPSKGRGINRARVNGSHLNAMACLESRPGVHVFNNVAASEPGKGN